MQYNTNCLYYGVYVSLFGVSGAVLDLLLWLYFFGKVQSECVSLFIILVHWFINLCGIEYLLYDYLYLIELFLIIWSLFNFKLVAIFLCTNLLLLVSTLVDLLFLLLLLIVLGLLLFTVPVLFLFLRYCLFFVIREVFCFYFVIDYIRISVWNCSMEIQSYIYP